MNSENTITDKINDRFIFSQNQYLNPIAIVMGYF